MNGVLHGSKESGWHIDMPIADYNKPELITNRYRVFAATPYHYSRPMCELNDGMEATYVRDSTYTSGESKSKDGKACRWTIYHDGRSTELHVDNHAFEQVNTPIPCPKVRKGIETRYRNGNWEKYSKAKGWIRA